MDTNPDGPTTGTKRDKSNEALIQQRIRLTLGHGHSRIFRNNVGALKDQKGRLVRYGLQKGSSDLIGWTTKEINGQRVAVFTAIEVKDKGRPTPEQLNFIAQVKAAGGIAGIARSSEEALEIVKQYNSDQGAADPAP